MSQPTKGGHVAEDDADDTSEVRAADDRWVRGPFTPRVALVVVPVTLLGALVAALGPIGDLGALLQAWVWTLVAGAFGVTAAWLIAVMLVPYVPQSPTTEAEGEADDLSSRREYRRRTG